MALSIVISSHKNKGLLNDGNAHIVEYFYPKQSLERADSKPLSDIIKSVSDALNSGKFEDTIGLAQRQEVNGATIREHRVYHGSGADFEAFDHSHMGEGEGAQAYGWGTYVTEVEGIGRTYAVQNAKVYGAYIDAKHEYEKAQIICNSILYFHPLPKVLPSSVQFSGFGKSVVPTNNVKKMKGLNYREVLGRIC